MKKTLQYQNKEQAIKKCCIDVDCMLKSIMKDAGDRCNKNSKIIIDAMNYSLFAGGKRLRPVLSLLTCEMLGGNRNRVLPFACAVEIIHTYSLIHDDLPEMDNDDLRRGQPSCHIRYGQAIALLAGDALLNLSYEIMAEENILHASPNTAHAMYEIAMASGYRGMIGGQVIDIQNSPDSKIMPEAMHRIMPEVMHRMKTGALIRASVLSAAHLCGASDIQLKNLSGYSEELGLAFQIRDDILDAAGNTYLTGKPSASDEKSGKTTYVSIFGAEGARKLLHEATENALAHIKSFGNAAENLEYIATKLESRES